jgi:hypothetical protein
VGDDEGGAVFGLVLKGEDVFVRGASFGKGEFELVEAVGV